MDRCGQLRARATQAFVLAMQHRAYLVDPCTASPSAPQRCLKYLVKGMVCVTAGWCAEGLYKVAARAQVDAGAVSQPFEKLALMLWLMLPMAMVRRGGGLEQRVLREDVTDVMSQFGPLIEGLYGQEMQPEGLAAWRAWLLEAAEQPPVPDGDGWCSMSLAELRRVLPRCQWTTTAFHREAKGGGYYKMMPARVAGDGEN